ncbi:hypothetical protein QQF64_013643 [Cirrhinus molitorella]|uniref:Integrase zinc-binding domain-containing protein n=1 Tax=Cirrhinus molitorella TaxID=172907 RepID=A0ABR3LVA5_9TELE
MEVLVHRLTEVRIRQQQIVEHIASRQSETERELAALRTAAAQRVPLPDPRAVGLIHPTVLPPRADSKARLPITCVHGDTQQDWPGFDRLFADSNAESGGKGGPASPPSHPTLLIVMELAHAHPMTGHLGVQNTIQCIRDRFHWPGLDADCNTWPPNAQTWLIQE